MCKKRTELKRGLHIWISDGKGEDTPEVKAMRVFLANLISDSVDACENRGVSLTALPSVFLNCFQEIFPHVVNSIVMDGGNDDDANNYMNSHKQLLEALIKECDLVKIKKKRSKG